MDTGPDRSWVAWVQGRGAGDTSCAGGVRSRRVVRGGHAQGQTQGRGRWGRAQVPAPAVTCRARRAASPGPRRPPTRRPFSGCGLPAPARPSAARPAEAFRTDLACPARRASGRRRRRAPRDGSEAGSSPTGAGLQRERQAENADRAGRSRRAAGDAATQGPPSDDDRQPVQLARKQLFDDGGPRGFELTRGSRGAPAGDAVRLLDERDADSLRARRIRHRDEVSRGYAAGCSVTEDQRGSRLLDRMQVSLRRAVRSIHVENRHRSDGASDELGCAPPSYLRERSPTKLKRRRSHGTRRR